MEQPKSLAAAANPGRLTYLRLVTARTIYPICPIFPFCAQEKVFCSLFVGRIEDMPKASGQISEADRLIAKRVRRIRFANKMTQAQFSEALGISIDRLASIEYERTPLTVGLADKISARFNANVIWLAMGEESMNPSIGLITEMFNSVDGSELLSKLSLNDLKYKMIIDPDKLLSPSDKNVSNDPHFVAVINKLRIMDEPERKQHVVSMLTWLERLVKMDSERHSPKAKSDRSFEKLITAMAEDYLIKTKQSTKDHLTDVILGDNVVDVKAILPELLKRLNSATRVRGSRTRLAKYMSVSLPHVSLWLSGKKEPGGENTLRLLNWVKEQERQK